MHHHKSPTFGLGSVFVQPADAYVTHAWTRRDLDKLPQILKMYTHTLHASLPNIRERERIILLLSAGTKDGCIGYIVFVDISLQKKETVK